MLLQGAGQPIRYVHDGVYQGMSALVLQLGMSVFLIIRTLLVRRRDKAEEPLRGEA